MFYQVIKLIQGIRSERKTLYSCAALRKKASRRRKEEEGTAVIPRRKALNYRLFSCLYCKFDLNNLALRSERTMRRNYSIQPVLHPIIVESIHESSMRQVRPRMITGSICARNCSLVTSLREFNETPEIR